MRFVTAAALAVAAFAAPGVVSADKAAAELMAPGGAVIGKTTFEQTPTGVLLYVDDHLTQPIGGAGARIACGVVTKE